MMAMNFVRRAAIVPAGLAAIIAVGWVNAGAEPVAFPANYRSGVLYNVIDREDQKEVHEQYTSREAIEAARAGGALPVGTVITSANYKARLDRAGIPMRDAKGNLIAGVGALCRQPRPTHRAGGKARDLDQH
jgi:hypothetical protein